MFRIALMATLAVSLPAFADEVKVNAPAPAFTLKDETGAEHSLAKYKGKVVVLEWTNPECPFVQRHYQADTMTNLAKAWKDKVVWLAVDSSNFVTPEKSAAWKKQESIPYPVLQDASGAVGKLYGAKTTPHMFVIDEQGTLRYMGGIDNDPRGSEAQPVNHVKAAVNAVLAGKQVPTSTAAPYGCSVKYKSS